MAENPQVKGGVVAYLTVDGATRAVELYKKAFGAEVDGYPLQAPAAFSLMLPVQDVDSWYARAVEAGCAAVMPPQDMFWGDRYGQVKDPFGVLWAFVGPKKKKKK
jgi:uncharacterized glyoxalase superfamily protein PhnB